MRSSVAPRCLCREYLNSGPGGVDFMCDEIWENRKRISHLAHIKIAHIYRSGIALTSRSHERPAWLCLKEKKTMRFECRPLSLLIYQINAKNVRYKFKRAPAPARLYSATKGSGRSTLGQPVTRSVCLFERHRKNVELLIRLFDFIEKIFFVILDPMRAFKSISINIFTIFFLSYVLRI